MKNSELKEYLNGFPDDSDIAVIIVNPKERKHYPLTDYAVITDMGNPVFLFEVCRGKVFEESRDDNLPVQTDFSDFPEVLP